MDSLLDFSNKTVLITGAAGGFGRLLAKGFAARGANLLLSDLHQDSLVALVESLSDFNGQIQSLAADVSREEDHIKLSTVAMDLFGGLHIAINNAGISQQPSHIHTMTEDSFNKQIDVNLKSVFFAMKHQLAAMLSSSAKEVGGGHILNVSSIAGTEAAPSIAGYSASKHGVIGLSKTAAVDYAKHNIRVNAVCPFLSPTPLVTDGFGEHHEAISKKISKRCPMGRLGDPQEMVNAMILLCSPANSYMNGQAIIVDGGVSAF